MVMKYDIPIISSALISFWLLFFHLVPLGCDAQQEITLREICMLPEQVLESSGLFIQDADSIWSHNDSGNNRKLYLVDTFGTRIRSIEMVGGNNIDWEDLAADDDGNLYIGDFGNNFQDRQDLVIYKTIHPALIQTETFFAEAIYFHYEDQTGFPPSLGQWYFDCEAMLAWGDSLLLFTKDYSIPYNGFTRIYQVPNIPGEHTAIFKGIFYTDNDNFFEGSVTGAALSPEKTRVALISNRKLWIFHHFTGQDFLNGQVTEFKFDVNTQKEAVAFLDECTLYITDELTGEGGGQLYAFDACEYITGNPPFPDIPEHPVIVSQDASLLYLDAAHIAAAMLPGAIGRLWNAQGQCLAEIALTAGRAAFDKTFLPAGSVCFYTLHAPTYGLFASGKWIAW